MRSLQLTMTLGDVLTIVTTVAAIVIAYGKIGERFTRIETQIGPLWQWWNTRIERRDVDERRV